MTAKDKAFSEQLEAKKQQYHQLLEEAVKSKEYQLTVANSKVMIARDVGMRHY